MGNLQHGGGMFPDPFSDMASFHLPQDIRKTFRLCRKIYMSNGIVKSATDRVAQYFITDIQIKDEDNKNAEELKKLLRRQKSLYLQASIDSIVFGNSFVVVYLPFTRMLICPNCKVAFNSDKVDYRFSNYKFIINCPGCKRSGEATVNDHKEKNPELVNFIRIDPEQVSINYDIFSGKSEYYWDISQTSMKSVINAAVTNKLSINSMPIDIMEVIKKDQNFLFTPKKFHHFKNPSLAGVSSQWGFPPYLPIMKLDHYNAVLRRANEAIALDFITPFRVLSPRATPAGDPMVMHSSDIFTSKMRDMVHRHRIDPCDTQIMPYPVEYQAFGAEAKALNVTPEIKDTSDEMLNSLNYPAELYRNNLQYQAMPSALRVFENTWEYLIEGANSLLQFTADHYCGFKGWKRMEVEFTKVKVADDMERKQIFMQLAAAQQISMMTALKPYDLDYAKEKRNVAYQAKIDQEIQQEMMRDMKEEAAMAPPGEASAQLSNPSDILGQATNLAMVLQPMPYEQRRVELNKISKMNPALHAVVLKKLEELRDQYKTEAGHQMMAQQGMLRGPLQ
jgi:hypothetical protein